MKSEIRNPKSDALLSEVQVASASSFRIRPSLVIRHSSFVIFTLIAVVTAPSAFACATCYGASDSPLAQGMNWGIMVLLGFIGMVLVAVSSFFVYIARRASAMEAVAAQNNLTETKQ
jgi:hypothetical protein